MGQKGLQPTEQRNWQTASFRHLPGTEYSVSRGSGAYEEVEKTSPAATAENKPQIMDPAKDDLLFESFLKKRKDKMKFAWAKYWFKLQNTTLFFYTKKEVDPSCLRGQYYMQSVQSVREMPATDTDFTFEIAMKNGKKKLLSAESAELRDVWMSFLWKSMQLPGPGRKNSSCTWYDIPDLVQRAQSASRDSVRENVNPERTSRGERVSESSLEPTQLSLPDVFHESDSKSDDAYDMPRPTPHEDTDVFRESDSEPDDVYDMPKPTPRDDTDSYQLCRESDDYSRSSEIYDVPRRYPSGVHPGENPYVPMDGLNLLDFSDPVNPVPGIVGDGACLGENTNG